MRCPSCASENPEGLKFCEQCAAPLKRRCARCGFDNSPAAKFCGECAAPLGQLSRAVAADRPPVAAEAGPAVRIVPEERTGDAIDGERKTVTALFADIKGSMDLMEGIDPEDARAIVDPALKLMMDAAQHYGGYIVQSTGDGIFALFGAPVAHEDHPQLAVYAALRMQDEMRRYSAKLRQAGNLPLEARVGVNSGEVVVRSIATGDGHVEYTPIGHSISLAARMQALAPTGSIAVTDTTRGLIEGYFSLKALGPTKIKGVSEPVEVFEVTGLGPLRTRLQRSASRGYTKFVGRQREMDTMKHAAEQAKAGHGQIVAAVAEPGVGKSRLFFEFKATSQSGWLVLEAVSVSHGKATAYLPLIAVLHDYFGIEAEDEPRRRREKVAGKVTLLDRSFEGTLPHLFALLGIVEGEDPFAQMDAQVRRRRTQDALKRILLRESLNQPLMLIFEDLHWIDEETQTFLNLLMEGMANAPVLMLVNYRPEYTHQWGSRTYYTQLRLDPLGQESADEMLNALLVGDAPELAPLKRLVLERTEGNPLFMEELVHALFDEGVLVRNGAVKVTRSLSQLKIPPTVQGILASRIDRLPSEAKELLQMLAVIGTEFPLSLVRQVVQLPDDRLDRMLSDLQTGEFIYEQPAAGDVEYRFKHALTHQAAYDALLAERRRLLHERIAQAIEAIYPEQLEDHYADLAHHYRSSSNIAKAVEYLRLAGEQAADRGAYAQALANVEPVLKLLGALPDATERLRAELGVRLLEGRVVPVLYGLGSEERLQASERVWELSERLGDQAALFRGMMNVAFVHVARGEIPRAQEMARRCVELAERNSNGEAPPAVQYVLATCALNSGDLLQASSLFGQMMTRLESAHQGDAASFTPINLWAASPGFCAQVQQVLGRPDEALKLSNEGLRRARELKRPFTLSAAYALAALLRHQRREPEAGRELAEAAIALAEEHGFGNWTARGRSVRGWALAESGQAAEGIAELEANAPLLPRGLQIQASAMLAHIYIRLGRADQALQLLDEVLAQGELTGLHREDADLHRLKGEAILMRDSSAAAEAEACFRKAIEIARSQSAKWWELRATVSLARLLDRTGRRDEARAMLAEIYNWFTEGFDTADLKDAEAVLEELNN